MARNFELSIHTQNLANGAGDRAFAVNAERAQEAAREREQRVAMLEDRLRFEDEESRRLTDDLYKLSASIERGAGVTLGGIGDLAHGAEVRARRALGANDNVSPNVLSRAGEHIMNRADSIEENHVSGMYREGLANSQPTGDLFAPSTWSMGENPNTADFFRNVFFSAVEDAPVYAAIAASTYLTRSTAPAKAMLAARGGSTAAATVPSAVGGITAAAQSAGGQTSENLERLRGMSDGELLEESGVYRDLLASRVRDQIPTAINNAEQELGIQLNENEKAQVVLALMDTESSNVREHLESNIRTESGGYGALTGLASGMALGRIFGNAGANAMQSYVRQVSGKIASAIGVESIQEVAEGSAGRYGFNVATGMDVSLTEGTFGEFVMGAGSGGLNATPTALLTSGREEDPETVRKNEETRLAVINRLQDEAVSVNEATGPENMREEFLDPTSEKYTPVAVLRNIRQRLTTSDPEQALTPETLEEARNVFTEAFTHSEGVIQSRTAIAQTFNSTANVNLQEASAQVDALEASIADMTDPVQQEATTQAVNAQRQQLQVISNVRDAVEKAGNIDAYMVETFALVAEVEGARPIEQGIVNNKIDAQNIESLRQQVLENNEAIKGEIASEGLSNVISFAMANPTAFETDEGKDLLDKVLTDKRLNPEIKKAYENYRNLNESIVNRNKKEGGLGRVNKDIIDGSKDKVAGTAFLGIRDYMQRIPRYMAAGRKEQAENQLALLGKFTRGHANKADAVQTALANAKSAGKTFHVAPTLTPEGDNTVWNVVEGKLDDTTRAKTGALNINAKSQKLVDSIVNEANLLNTTFSTLNAVVNDLGVSREEFTAVQNEVSEASKKADVELQNDAVKREAEVAENTAETVDTETAEPTAKNEKTKTPLTQTVVVKGEELVRSASIASVVKNTATVKEAVNNIAEVVRNSVAGVFSENLWKKIGNWLNNKESENTADIQTVANQIETVKNNLVVPVIQKYVQKTDKGFIKDPAIGGLLFNDAEYTQVNDEVATAIAAHVMNYITGKGYSGFRNSDESLRQLFDLNPEEGVYPQLVEMFGSEERARMAYNSSPTFLVLQELGKNIYRDTVSFSKDAPANLENIVIGHLGSIGFAVLNDMGYLTRQRENRTVQAEDGTNKTVPTVFTTLTEEAFSILEALKTEDFDSPVLKNSLLASTVKTSIEKRNALAKVLKPSEQRRDIPYTEAENFDQESIKNSDREVPKNLSVILDSLQKQAHYFDPVIVKQFQRYNDNPDMEQNSLALLMGYTREDGMKKLTLGTRKKAQDKNDQIAREIGDIEAALHEFGDGKPFYFNRMVAKQQRVHYNNGFNPQENKVFRALVTMETWQEMLTAEDATAAENNFLLALGEAFGEKSDSQADVVSVQNARNLLNEAVEALSFGVIPMDSSKGSAIAQAVIALDLMEQNGEPASEHMAEIVAGMDAGGEGYHTYEGLVHLARAARHMVDNGSLDGFEHGLWREVDGKTNGPMLGLFNLFGNGDVAEMLKAGGFYTAADKFTKLSDYMSNGGKDLYQLIANKLIGILDSSSSVEQLSALYHFWGVLSKDGEVQSKGRNFAKPITTQVFYGSGVKAILKKMTAENFVDNIYAKVEENLSLIENAGDEVTTRAALNSLKLTMDNLRKFIPQNELNRFSKIFKREAALLQNPSSMNFNEFKDNFELQQIHVNAIEAGFSAMLFQPIKDLFGDYLGGHLETAGMLNATANISYNLHEYSVNEARNSLLTNLVKSGERAEGKTTGTQNRYDLRLSEVSVIERIFNAMKPYAHTYLSKRENNPAAALPVGKREDLIVVDEFNEDLVVRFERVNTEEGKEYQFKPLEFGISKNKAVEPGVSLIIQLIHSMDSAIAHINDIDTQTENLHVHDAKITAASLAAKMGIQFNKNTFEVLRDYSVAQEVLDMYKRTFNGFFKVYNDATGKNETETLKHLKKALTNVITKDMFALAFRESDDNDALLTPKRFSEHLRQLENEAKNSTLKKLRYMRDLTHVDQYSINEGVFVLSDAERASIDKMIQQVEKQESDETLTRKLQIIENALYKNIQPMSRKAFEKTETDELSAYAVQQEEKPAITDAAIAAKNPIELTEASSRVVITQKVNTVTKLIDALKAASINEGNNPALNMISKIMDKSLLKLNKLRDVPVIVIKDLQHAQEVAKKMGREYGDDNSVESLITNNSNAMYVVTRDGKEAILLKEDGFVHVDGSEYVFESQHALHEVWHAITAGKIGVELAKPAHKRSKSFQQFEKLYEVVKNTPEFSKWADTALNNITEFAAWGMTNPEFAQALHQFKLTDKTGKPTPFAKAAGLVVNDFGWNRVKTLFNSFVRYLTGITTSDGSRKEQSLLSTFLFNNIMIAQASRNPKGVFKVEQSNIARMAMANAGPAVEINQMNAQQVFEALDTGNVKKERKDYLQNLLTTVTSKVLDKAGRFYEAAKQQQALRPEDRYTKSLATGRLPFASYAKGSKHVALTDQEAFVLDQVEAVFAGYLINEHGMVQNIEKLFKQAESNLTAADFYDGNWYAATPTEQQVAEALRQAVFSREAHPDSNYLARFAALSLVHQQVGDAVSKVHVPKSKRKNETALDYLNTAWELSAELALGELDLSKKSLDQRKRMQNMLEHLADSEAVQKNYLIEKVSSFADKAESALDTSARTIDRLATEALDKSTPFAEKVPRVGSWVSAANSWKKVADQNFIGNTVHISMDKYRQSFNKSQLKNGIVAATLSEVRGGFDSMSRYAHKMIRHAKTIEHKRMQKQFAARQNLIKAFANEGKNLTEASKKAITLGLLKTDAQVFINDYSMENIANLYSNDMFRDREIETLQNSLSDYSSFNERLVLIKDLAHYLATEKNTSEHLLQSAEEIAEMVGLTSEGNISAQEIAAVTPIINKLVSLYSINYMDSKTKTDLNTLFQQENAREEGNGLEVALQYHREVQRKSKLIEFRDSFMPKGFTAEILNDKKTVVAATDAEGKKLLQQGFVKGNRVNTDSDDAINMENRHAYVMRNGGLGRILTGAISYTNKHSNWQDTVKTGNLDSDKKVIAATKRVKERKLLMQAKDAISYDPSTKKEAKMIPTIRMNKGNKSTIKGYHYTLDRETKDNLLGRHSAFEDVLAKMETQTYDREASQKQNEEVIKGLYDEFKTSHAQFNDSNSYIEVGPNSRDTEVRQMYELLPNDTKEAIKSVWGGNSMYIRADVLDSVLGYRKYSVTQAFNKEAEHRKWGEAAFVNVMDAVFQGKGELNAARGEEVLIDLVKHIRDMAVVKNLFTLVLNIKSNASQLVLAGLSFKQSFKLQREGLAYALAYRRDSAELEELRQMDMLGIDDAARTARIRELEALLKNNKAAHLIEAGLMPTVVEGVDMVEDPFSYKGLVEEKLSKFTEKVPESFKTVAKNLYMTHDTKLYKFMSGATQLSDFTARYALYEYNTRLKKGVKLNHEGALQASSEEFINYDIPTHKAVQYMNDTGLLFYTKYYWRVQAVLYRHLKERPARALGMAAAEHYMDNLGSVMGSGIHEAYGNPLHGSLLKYPGAVENTMVIKGLTGILQ